MNRMSPAAIACDVERQSVLRKGEAAVTRGMGSRGANSEPGATAAGHGAFSPRSRTFGRKEGRARESKGSGGKSKGAIILQ